MRYLLTCVCLVLLNGLQSQITIKTEGSSGNKIAVLPSMKFPSGTPVIEFRKNGSGTVEFHNQDAAAFDILNNPVNYTFKNEEGTSQIKCPVAPNNRWIECPEELLDMLKKEGEMSFKAMMKTHKYDLSGARAIFEDL